MTCKYESVDFERFTILILVRGISCENELLSAVTQILRAVSRTALSIRDTLLDIKTKA
jgi:hypothetical protein